MENYLRKARYYLEIVALPAFIYLVAHMSGHGISLLVDGEHSHEHGHGHEEVAHGLESLVGSIFTVEVLSGILLLITFTWIWHRPFMKKLVPCSHDCCKHVKFWPHFFATAVFVVHFFPEASVRHTIFETLTAGEILSVVGLIAFASHFLVDILIAIMLSSYWGNEKKFWISMITIVGSWLAAFYFGEHVEEFIPHLAEGALFLVSSFLLAMFVHKPHAPKH